MTTQVLESTGHLCVSLQQPYAKVLEAIDALGLRPAQVIDGVAHWDADQCQRIAEVIRHGPPV